MDPPGDKGVIIPSGEARRSQTVSDGLRRSQTVSDGLRRSQTVSDGLRRSQTVSDGLRRSQTVSDGLRRGDDGVKNIGFLVKFAAQEAYLLKCSKYKLFSGTQ